MLHHAPSWHREIAYRGNSYMPRYEGILGYYGTWLGLPVTELGYKRGCHVWFHKDNPYWIWLSKP